MLRAVIAVVACAQVAVAFNVGSSLPSLGLRHASASSILTQGRQRKTLTLGNNKRAAQSLQSAAADSATTAAREAKKGRGQLRARPIGVGHAAPEVSISNADMEKIVETTGEWIQSRTGIENRHVLRGKETLRDLAIKAGKAAIKDAGINAEDIDLVIVATSSPDDMFGDAPSVATGVGASKNAFAFDLTAACSGFLFATVTASQFLNNGGHTTALVVGADALTRWVDWTDRNTCVLFGDGAGAMVLTSTEATEEGGILGFEMHSDGAGYCNLQLPYQQSDRAVGPEHSVIEGKYTPIGMNGKEVYKFATREVPEVIEEALANAGLTTDDVDHLLLHQANIRIMEIVAQRLGIPMEKVIHNLEEYGNTSAASIPLALAEAVRSGRIKKGDVIACAGFGAGLSWGSTIMRWG